MHNGTHAKETRRGRAGRSAALRGAAALLLALASASCGDLQRQGAGSSFLLVNVLEAAPGSEPDTFGGTLSSDVITVVDEVAGVYSDLGRVRFSLGLKDPGSAGAPNAPSTANFITITRYRVRYIRADGRNVQGVDVPYGFDGAITATVGAGEVITAFTLVRQIAKMEAPLKALTSNGSIISTIAEVTFYGHDQTGREVTAVASMSIDFGNFVDKADA